VDCVCGTTEYTHATEPTTLIRFYVVVAVPECGP